MKKFLAFGGSLLLTFTFFGSSFAQIINTPRTNQTATAQTAPKANSPVTVEKIESDFDEALKIIETNHVNGKKLDYNEVFKSSIESMLHTLDPHSNYLDAKDTEQFRTSQQSQYFGIGASIGSLSDKDGKIIATYIRATFDGTPANKAGLRYGDKILSVNGESMLGKTTTEVSTALRGAKGTTAKIVVERHATGTNENITITRDAVSQPSISESYILRPGVGYMALSGGFNYTTFDEFRAAMRDLKAQGMTQLILDLRNNGGGLVIQALNIANTFLQEGQTILTQKGRVRGASRQFDADNPEPDTTPLVLIVNRNTASASEILTGALQDHDRALVVGETTFGKGLVQNPIPLEYDGVLLLTIAKYLTPSGRLIQRDYSNGNLYDYYYNGGSLRDDNTVVLPTGEKKETDTGRPVYGGNGITPDVAVKPETITNEVARLERRLNDPAFAFAMDLAYGKIKGFENYKVDQPIAFNQVIKKEEFPIPETLYKTFRDYAVKEYKFTPAQVDHEREFVERVIRTELATAKYGATTSIQIFNEIDNQLLEAIKSLPEAKQLAVQARANLERSKNEQ